MILFQTNVVVPKHIIDQIGIELRHLLIKEMASRSLSAISDLNENIIHEVSDIMTTVVHAYASKLEKSCDGWSLTKEQAENIAYKLRKGLKIMAIKGFRKATGAGLADSKYFIEKFGLGEVAAVEFLAVFV